MNGYFSGLMRRSRLSFHGSASDQGSERNILKSSDGGERTLNDRDQPPPFHHEETIVSGIDYSSGDRIHGLDDQQSDDLSDPSFQFTTRKERGSAVGAMGAMGAMGNGTMKQWQVGGDDTGGIGEGRSPGFQEQVHESVFSMNVPGRDIKSSNPRDGEIHTRPFSGIADHQSNGARDSEVQGAVRGSAKNNHENEKRIPSRSHEDPGDRSSNQREARTTHLPAQDQNKNIGSSGTMVETPHLTSSDQSFSSDFSSKDRSGSITTSKSSTQGSETTVDSPADQTADGQDALWNRQINPSLRDVMEWVARSNEIEISGVKDEENTIRNEELEREHEMVSEPVIHPPIPVHDSSIPEPADNKIQDLDLSIGSITISMEGSGSDIRSLDPSHTDRRTEKISRNRNTRGHGSGTRSSNRLSRHYIRI